MTRGFRLFVLLSSSSSSSSLPRRQAQPEPRYATEETANKVRAHTHLPKSRTQKRERSILG